VLQLLLPRGVAKGYVDISVGSSPLHEVLDAMANSYVPFPLFAAGPSIRIFYRNKIQIFPIDGHVADERPFVRFEYCDTGQGFIYRPVL